MAFANNIEHIEFETADDFTFTSGLQTHKVNILTAPLLFQIEELMRYASGRAENRYYPKLDIELYPFSTRPQAAFPDTSDKIGLINFLKTNKALRIKDCTLERYETGGIASARALLLSLKLRVTGASESLDKDKAEESFTLTVESINPV